MLVIDNIFKHYRDAFNPALQNVSLSLNWGDFCILIGPNGSGKSTLIKSITGECLIDEGSISLNGINLNNLPIHIRAKNLAHVTQDLNIGSIGEMTILENIALSYLRTHKASLNFYEYLRPIVFQHLQKIGIGLEHKLDCRVAELSGGQRQIINTAMAILSGPDLLLLDEHTSALDPKAKHIIMSYANSEIITNQITTLMITHSFDDAINYGNRIIMMHQGQIVVDISGNEKKQLTPAKLLELFHYYENQTLIS